MDTLVPQDLLANEQEAIPAFKRDNCLAQCHTQVHSKLLMFQFMAIHDERWPSWDAEITEMEHPGETF